MGSTQILGPVPARSLDPMVLVQSQPPEMRGYVVLSSRGSTDSSSCSAKRNWDAIFLAGNLEPDCLRLTESARATIPFLRVKHDLQNAGRADLTVHLFEAPEKLLREFLSLTDADPVLKVTLDALDIRQIEALLVGSPVRDGLLERSDFTGQIPRFELTRVSTLIDNPGIPFALPQLQLGYEKGGLALYQFDPTVERATPAIHDGTGTPGRKALPRRTPVSNEADHDRSDATESLMRIIDSVLTGREHRGARPTAGRATAPAQPPNSSREVAGTCESPEILTSPQGSAAPTHGHVLDARGSIAPAHEADPVLMLFQRLFRSFRKKAVDCLGSRWEEALRSAAERVRFLTPEFQADALTPLTAPQMLDLILEVIASAPILKRSRLRESALLLIADLYDKHYDLLETRGLVDRVEQAYLRLKK